MSQSAKEAPLPFRLYVVAAGGDTREAIVDRLVLLATRAKTRAAVYWRAEGEPPAAELRAFRTPLLVKESDLAAWPRLRAEGGAAGVHLKSDASIDARTARARFPRPARIARAVHTADEAARARDEGADFAVFGHVYETPSKPGVAPRGLAALAEACAAAAPLPVFALGGVTAERIPELRAAGAWGVATMRALLAPRDPRRALDSWLEALDR